MPQVNNDPGLSWARQIIEIHREQEREEEQKQAEAQEEADDEPDTVKVNNCMHWGLIFMFVCVLAFLASALVVWFVLMN